MNDCLGPYTSGLARRLENGTTTDRSMKALAFGLRAQQLLSVSERHRPR